MKRFLFFSIGNRDMQATYETSSRKWRKLLKYEHINLEDFQDIEAYCSESYRESHGGDKTDEQYRNGITFPILCKTLAYLQENNVKKLDTIFLIATNRTPVLQKLLDIQAAWDANIEAVAEDPKWMEMYEYLSAGILFHAQKDKTSDIAHFMEKRIKDGKIPLYGLEVQDVQVLDLGLHGSFDPILKHEPPSKKLKIETLSKADINTLGFFEYELYQALKPYFADLEDSCIYLGTHSGGMPLMNRALDSVLQGAVNYAKYERIFSSEYLSYQLDHSFQGRFLGWLKKMNDNVMALNWDTAQYYCTKILNSQQGSADRDRFTKLAKIIQGAINLNATKARWYERFTAQIFRSLYAVNMDETVVWMRSMQERAFHHIVKSQCKKLWDRVVDGKEIALFPDENNRTIYVRLYLDALNGKVDDDKLREAFKDYIPVFSDEKNLLDSDEWLEIIKFRNKLLHEGKPVSPSSMQTVLDFLHIKLDDLREAIACLQENNLKKVMEFESKCLGNPYFSALGAIAGFDDTVLQERKKSQDFFDALHKS